MEGRVPPQPSNLQQCPPAQMRHMFMSPVYVKRNELFASPRKTNHITESCTQTSKTIIELAKIETGYMSPDSLNSSPRLVPESPHKYRAEKEDAFDCNAYQNPNSYYAQQNERMMSPHRNVPNIQPDSSVAQKNQESEIQSYMNERKTFMERFRDFNIDKMEPNTSISNMDDMNSMLKLQELCSKNDDTPESPNSFYPADKEFECNFSALYADDNELENSTTDMPQNFYKSKSYEVWHAEIYNENERNKKEEKQLESPILVNLQNQGNCLLNQFLAKQKDFDTTKVPRKKSPFYLQSKSLKSQSYVESSNKQKMLETTFINFDDNYQLKTNDYDQSNLDNHNTTSSNFSYVNKRSNTFMSPTLSSEQKSVKPSVDSVKNLVGMTCKGRAVSPISELRESSKDELMIPYIDQINSAATTQVCRSDEVDKKNNSSREESYMNPTSSTSSIVGSHSSSENGIFIVLSHVKSPNWNYALKGLAEIVELARNGDPETFMPFMTTINQRLLELLRSPRSHVTRTACQIAGHLFEIVKDTRRPEFDDIVNILLYKTADASKFIRQDANLALDCMVTHIATFHAIRSLCTKGPTHRNPLVRCAAIRLLICAVVIAGPKAILKNPSNEHSRKRIIVNLVHFMEDKHLDTRKYAERLYKILSKDSSFEFFLKKYLDRTTLESFYRTVQLLKKA